MAELAWSATADEVEQMGQLLLDMAVNVRAGYMEAAHGGDGYLFRNTPLGREFDEQAL